MAVSLEFDDLDRLVASLSSHTAGMESRLALVVRKAAFDVERIAKTLAPVDTGFLKNSIHTEIVANNWRVYAADVIADAHYAGFVEYGTSRMAPQPYMGPALDRVAPGFEAALEALVTEPGPFAIGIGGASSRGMDYLMRQYGARGSRTADDDPTDGS